MNAEIEPQIVPKNKKDISGNELKILYPKAIKLIFENYLIYVII